VACKKVYDASSNFDKLDCTLHQAIPKIPLADAMSQPMIYKEVAFLVALQPVWNSKTAPRRYHLVTQRLGLANLVAQQ
jgi:hypothetical protein